MHYVITQLVVSTPPDVSNPVIHIVVDGIEHTYTTTSIISQHRKAFIQLNEFWLVYTDGLKISNSAKATVSIVNNNITVGLIALDDLSLGIRRYHKKDFKVQRYLPNEIFLDVIVEEKSVPSASEGEQMLRDTLKRLAVQQPIGNDSLHQQIAVETQSKSPFLAVKPPEIDEKTASKSIVGYKAVKSVPNKTNYRDSVVPALQNSINTSNTHAEETASYRKSTIESKIVKSSRKLPPPPGMLVHPAVSLLEGVDALLKTLFPRVGWKPVLSVKGSVYEKPLDSSSTLAQRWNEIEEDFKRKFCIRRGLKQTPSFKTEKTVKIQRILSERQEFLLSIVFESLKKSKVSLKTLIQELLRWIETEEPAPNIEGLVNLAGVFPSDKDCLEISKAAHQLTEVEETVKFLLSSGCDKNKLLLIKYVHWADPSIAMLISALQKTRKSLILIQEDNIFPSFLLLLLKLGNLVNYKYAESASRTVAKGFSLSSVSAFSKCGAEIVNQEGCKLSLLEFLILAIRDKIDLNEMVKKYSVFQTIEVKSLKDHYTIIKSGYNEVFALEEFNQKNERLHKIFLLIKECEYLISEVDTRLLALSKSYTDTPECFIENMIDAFSSIQQYCSLFR